MHDAFCDEGSLRHFNGSKLTLRAMSSYDNSLFVFSLFLEFVKATTLLN